jgi:hypothetical protein
MVDKIKQSAYYMCNCCTMCGQVDEKDTMSSDLSVPEFATPIAHMTPMLFFSGKI